MHFCLIYKKVELYVESASIFRTPLLFKINCGKCIVFLCRCVLQGKLSLNMLIMASEYVRFCVQVPTGRCAVISQEIILSVLYPVKMQKCDNEGCKSL